MSHQYETDAKYPTCRGWRTPCPGYPRHESWRASRCQVCVICGSSDQVWSVYLIEKYLARKCGYMVNPSTSSLYCTSRARSIWAAYSNHVSSAVELCSVSLQHARVCVFRCTSLSTHRERGGMGKRGGRGFYIHLKQEHLWDLPANKTRKSRSHHRDPA